MSKEQVSKISWYSIGLMTLTSIHHVYGAVIYNTPWRLHILMISIPVIVFTLVLNRVLQKKDPPGAPVLVGLFILITLVPSAGLIGVFEGLYNHVLKNILFFGGASEQLLGTMFPAPKYEMPNDFMFEVTGTLQGVVAVPLIMRIIRLASSALILKRTV